MVLLLCKKVNYKSQGREKSFFYFVLISLKYMPWSSVSFGSENKIHNNLLYFLCFVHCYDEGEMKFVLAPAFSIFYHCILVVVFIEAHEITLYAKNKFCNTKSFSQNNCKLIFGTDHEITLMKKILRGGWVTNLASFGEKNFFNSGFKRASIDFSQII